MEALRLGRDQFTELTGLVPESVSSFERTAEGWVLEIEVLELARVPDTVSLLASYEVELTADGELAGYRRVRRYERGRADPHRSGGRSPTQQTGGGGGSSGLYDVLELVLDRGLVIDAFVRVSVVGIEILKIDIRVVVASVDTFLRFAEACNRLDLEAGPRKPPGLPDLVGEITESGARGKSKGALSGAAETISDAFNQAREEGKSEERPRPRKTAPTRSKREEEQE